MAALAVSPISLEKRRATDCGGTVFFLLTTVAAVAVGIYGYSEGSDTLKDYFTNCIDIDPSGGGGGGGGTTVVTPSWTPVLIKVSPYFGGALGLSVLVGIVWMTTFYCCPRVMVYGTLILQGLVLVALGAALFIVNEKLKENYMEEGICYALTECPDPIAMYYRVIPFALAAIYFLVLMCIKHKIELTATLLEQAVKVLGTHPAVFLASAVYLLIAAAVYVFIVGAAVLLLATGFDADPNGTCGVEFTTSIKVGYFFLILFAYWSMQLFFAMRFYVISLTTGVWYFNHSANPSEAATASLAARTSNPVSKGFCMAFTTSFGTLCLASLIMAIIEYLKSLVRKNRQGNLLSLLVACCLMCILNYLEFLSRFAISYHALTGEPLCEAARHMFDHMSRHGFTAYTVDRVASMVLRFGGFVLALAVGVLCAYTAYPEAHQLLAGASGGTSVVLTATAVFAIVCVVIASAVLGFIAGIMLNVVDAAYCCLAIDMDGAQPHKPEIANAIHGVVVKAQPVVVQNPGYVGQQHANVQLGQVVVHPVHQGQMMAP